jgi:hypothetical protein
VLKAKGMFGLDHCFEIFSQWAGRESTSADSIGGIAVPILVAFPPPEFIGRRSLTLRSNLNGGERRNGGEARVAEVAKAAGMGRVAARTNNKQVDST